MLKQIKIVMVIVSISDVWIGHLEIVLKLIFTNLNDTSKLN